MFFKNPNLFVFKQNSRQLMTYQQETLSSFCQPKRERRLRLRHKTESVKISAGFPHIWMEEAALRLQGCTERPIFEHSASCQRIMPFLAGYWTHTLVLLLKRSWGVQVKGLICCIGFFLWFMDIVILVILVTFNVMICFSF